ncbi:HesB/IscA family protein [Vacuolonema iberomarrocanum]|uniref:HesB/IscA family protein n=1 Tax=Vacuolonema iberomarrocanum TaxID=3454632 RepID=UPI0019DA243A|nr:iron-sulfur cluster assembly accessory protein [filamentous cyanobacterium LEGE 07170]
MIYLSPEAAQEVQRLINTGSNPKNRVFRLGVQSGGCSGLVYTLTPSADLLPTDLVWDWDDLKIAIAPDFLPQIDGMTLDFAQDLMGGGFRFHNPNAVETCGCGASFSVAATTPPPPMQ